MSTWMSSNPRVADPGGGLDQDVDPLVLGDLAGGDDPEGLAGPVEVGPGGGGSPTTQLGTTSTSGRSRTPPASISSTSCREQAR